MTAKGNPTDKPRGWPGSSRPESETRAYQSHLLYLVSLAVTLAAAFSLVVALVAVPQSDPWTNVALGLFLTAGLAGFALRRAGRAPLSRLSLALLLVAGYLVAALGPAYGSNLATISGPWILAWFGVMVLAIGLLFGRFWALGTTVLGLAALPFALLPGEGVLLVPQADNASVILAAIPLVLFAYLLNLVFEAIARARAHGQELQRDLWQTKATLQGQVEDRTRAVALAARVGRQLTRIHDLDTLLSDAVELIRDRFDLYHVQVYLLNPVAQELTLRAATGEAGAELLRRRHRLHAGPGSINGTAATNRQPVVVSEARRSPLFLSNPLLPETQSEMAIPMVVEDEVIGILDLQSSQPEGLNADNLAVFSILAAQLATAVDNARLFAEIAETREQLARQAELLTRSGWQRYLEEAEGGQALPDQPPLAVDTPDRLRQPITVRGTTIGYLELDVSPPAAPRGQELMAAVAGQLGAHLENLRLTQQAETALEEARRREEELALVNRVVTALAATPDLASSLQIVVDQLAMATAITQVGVAILNEERTALTVLADRAGKLNTESAVGAVIPLENNTASQMAIAERRTIVVENATENPLTASAHEVLRHRGVRTIVILPLVVENDVIGTVGLDVITEGIELTEGQLRLAETIVYQAATAIQRARLFNQTEQARRDAESLYALSGALNAAQDLDAILGAVVVSHLAAGASSASLSTIELDSDGRPEWTTLAALWVEPQVASELAISPPDIGTRFNVAALDVSQAWLAQPNEPVLVENVLTDGRVDDSLRTLLTSLGVQSLAALPLQVRDRWVGLVAVSWNASRRFDTHDRQLYRAMATQLAVALSGHQLFEQVRNRSRQLERLSRIEADLSLATTEDEILLAVASGTNWEGAPSFDLTYLSTRSSDGALMAEPVSHWRDGRTTSVAGTSTLLRSLPLSPLWLDHPRVPLLIEDAESDPRLNEAMRDQARREGWRTLALLPLRRGGQWQGLFSVGWPGVHPLAADETFLLQRLHEPLAATVASRRAYLAQRLALAQTEALYNVSARLNMAQSYDDVLGVIRQFTELGRAADALQFVHFDRPWTVEQVPETFSILAEWNRDGTLPNPRREPVVEYPVLSLLRGDRLTVFADVANDPRLDRATRASLHASSGARSVIFAPLVVGGQWIGYVSLIYVRQGRSFAEEEIDRLAGLIGQVAVAAHTILLLEQTRQLLASEQRQRRIADTLLTSARVMSETLDETLLRDVLATQLCDTVPAAMFVNLYEWRSADHTFRLDRRVEQPKQRSDDFDHGNLPIGAVFAADDRPDLWQPLASGAGLIQPSPGAMGEFYRLPWRVGRQAAGVVEVFRAAPGQYPAPLTVDDQRRCEGIIQQAALAIQNAQSYGQTQAALANQARLSAELRAVSDVSLAAAATLDADRLLGAAADLTRESFNLYHAHIYLYDDARRLLVLRAGSGEIGRRMLREGRQIPVDARSIAARAAREREVVVVADTGESPDFLPHPLLPQTRSEMALPMIVGERLLGVLDVQSEQVDRFQPDDVLVHKILAAQLAVATQNASYFAEQLRTAEKLREVDRLKTDFLARMSHELRTPLNSIIGFADVLLMGLDGDLTERMIEDLQLIRSSGYHLRDIIGDILDMSKIEAGRLDLVFEPFDVERVAAELMATAAPLAEQKGLALRLDIAPDTGPLVADRTRIRQVLWNILGNAIKFTDRGEISVKVWRDNGEVRFQVRDTGIGIAEENLPRIFDPFNQVEPGRRGSISGTGLGLSISKSLVELHGGHILVESQPGRGSSFSFSIPSRAASPAIGEKGL